MSTGPDPAALRRRAMLRLCLGSAQMIGACVAVTLLLMPGVNEWSIAATVITAGLTLTSRILFSRDDRSQKP